MKELRCPKCDKLVGKISVDGRAVFESKCPRSVCGASFTLTLSDGKKQPERVTA